MSRRVDVGWETPDDEEPMIVTLSVGEPQPEIRWGEHAQEGLAGEVTVLSVREDTDEGRDRTDLIPVAAADILLLEQAQWEAGEAEREDAIDEADDFDPVADAELAAAHGS